MIAKRRNILVCDDDPDLLKFVTKYLEADLWDVVSVDNGEDALRHLRTYPVEFLLLDLLMPGTDGIAVLKAIQAENIDCSVLMISSVEEAATAVACMREGAEDFINKPIDPVELKQRLDVAIEQRRKLRFTQAVRAQLERSESVNRNLMDANPDAIFVTTAEGKVLYRNATATQVFGSKTEVGSRLQELCDPHIQLLLSSFIKSAERTELRPEKFELPMIVASNSDVASFELTGSSVDPVALGLIRKPLGRDVGLGGRIKKRCVYIVARDVSQRVTEQRVAQRQATHDFLTNLPNRGLFRDRLLQLIRHAEPSSDQFALAILDIDRFQMINVGFGSAAADQLLRAMAERLQSKLPGSGSIARIAGDEFAFLLPNVANAEDAAGQIENMLAALADGFTIDDQDIRVSASVGMSLFPTDGICEDGLMECASTALRHAKVNSRGSIRRYDNEMGGNKNFFSLEADLRRALGGEQFWLSFQPQVDLRDLRICGIEALLRWNHPTRGQVPPSEFIALAEESGLIVPIGEWVLQQACSDAADLMRSSGWKDLTIAVNISAAQLSQPNFEETVLTALADSGLPATALELEVTEHVVMSELDLIAPRLERLARAGVQIAIDDFGTGYSSLGYLRQLPLNSIKIDRIFVRDLSDSKSRTIVDAVISIAQKMQLNLISEGVESWEQLKYLVDHGCNQAQGFLFGEPCSLLEIRNLLDVGMPALQLAPEKLEALAHK